MALLRISFICSQGGIGSGCENMGFLAKSQGYFAAICISFEDLEGSFENVFHLQSGQCWRWV